MHETQIEAAEAVIGRKYRCVLIDESDDDVFAISQFPCCYRRQPNELLGLTQDVAAELPQIIGIGLRVFVPFWSQHLIRSYGRRQTGLDQSRIRCVVYLKNQTLLVDKLQGLSERTDDVVGSGLAAPGLFARSLPIRRANR